MNTCWDLIDKNPRNGWISPWGCHQCRMHKKDMMGAPCGLQQNFRHDTATFLEECTRSGPKSSLNLENIFLYWFKHAISGSEIWKHVVEPLDKNPRPSLWTSTLLSADGEVVLDALGQSRNMPLGYWFSLADFSWWLWCLGPHGEWQCQCSTGTCLWPLQTMDEGKQNPAPEFWLMIVYNINIL